jgi:hypothetical protein
MVRSLPATNIQLGLLLQAGVVMTALKHLGSCHESGLLSRQVGREVFMKLRWVKISEAVGCLLYRIRLAEIAGESLSVVSFIFSGVRHVGRDVDQTQD